MTTALLLGATGLIGAALLNRLATDATYEKIVTFVRRPSSTKLPHVDEVVVDYDAPDTYRSHIAVHDVFCCLGTTIKKAGSQVAFRHVDLEIPLALAKESLAAGAKRYLVVTAVGSDAKSSTFYNRVKGELEDQLRPLPFPGGIKIFHPSLLLGDRAEERAGEKIGAVVMAVAKPFLVGRLQRFRAISATSVADAMAHVAKTSAPGVKVYEGAELFAAAAR